MPPEVNPPNNAEIEQALKEFEMKSSVAPEIPSKPFVAGNTSKMVALVIKWSGGKLREQQANYVLLGLAIIAIFISLFLFFHDKTPEAIIPTGKRIVHPPNQPPSLEDAI